MSRDSTIAIDVLNAAKLTVEFTDGMDSKAFSEDAKTQSAVLYKLLVLGEAVKRLTEDFRSEHSELPWKLMAGMRDQLIHNYDSVDVDLVWKTLQKDIPTVITVLTRLLAEE